MARFINLQGSLPTLRVHVWGGLGSQLFALVAVNRLRAKWPNRRIALVFHSSGVTQRFKELRAESTIGFKVIQRHDFCVEDFRTRNTEGALSSHTHGLKQILKTLLLRSRFLGKLNTDIEFSDLRPWLLSVRGHYSELTILPDEVRSIANLVNLDIDHELDVNRRICIHLRLGDLLSLENKSHIPIERISALPEIAETDEKFVIYSDSEVDVTKSLWSSNIPHKSANFLSLGAHETIRECVNSKIFIGTNSKISIWIAALRLGLNMGDKTLLPMELKHYVSTMFKNLNAESKILLY